MRIIKTLASNNSPKNRSSFDLEDIVRLIKFSSIDDSYVSLDILFDAGLTNGPNKWESYKIYLYVSPNKYYVVYRQFPGSFD